MIGLSRTETEPPTGFVTGTVKYSVFIHILVASFTTELILLGTESKLQLNMDKTLFGVSASGLFRMIPWRASCL